MSCSTLHNINWCLGDGATLRLANNMLWSVRRTGDLNVLACGSSCGIMVFKTGVQNKGESQGCNNQETRHRKVMNFEWAVVDRVFMHGVLNGSSLVFVGACFVGVSLVV